MLLWATVSFCLISKLGLWMSLLLLLYDCFTAIRSSRFCFRGMRGVKYELSYMTINTISARLVRDAIQHHMASDQGLHCLLTGFSIKNREKVTNFIKIDLTALKWQMDMSNIKQWKSPPVYNGLSFKEPITTATDDIYKHFFHCFSEQIRLDVSVESSATQRIHLKNQALFSSKDKSKKLKCHLLLTYLRNPGRDMRVLFFNLFRRLNMLFERLNILFAQLIILFKQHN